MNSLQDLCNSINRKMKRSDLPEIKNVTKMASRYHGKPYNGESWGNDNVGATRMVVREHGKPYKELYIYLKDLQAIADEEGKTLYEAIREQEDQTRNEKLNYSIEKFANQTSQRTHTNQTKNMTEEEIARIRKHLLEREKLMTSIGDGKIKMSGLVNKLKMDIQDVQRLTQSLTFRDENVPELMRVSNKISMVGDMIDDTLEAIQTLEYDIDEDEEALEKLDATLQTLAESFGIEWDKLEQVGGDIGTLLRG